MKQGKALEQLLVVIQEYLKDSPNTHVVPNAMLLDRSGIKREIDVFVQSKLQGGNIGIAFECKDYKKKVDVAVVEAFNSKCNDIQEIHKGIIVSSNGFTSGAQSKAQFYGIDLFQLGNVPLQEIFNPFDLFYTQCWVEMALEYRVVIEEDKTSAHFTGNGVYSVEDNNEVEMISYLANTLRMYMPSLIPSIHNYLHAKGITVDNVPLSIRPVDKLYIKDTSGSKHNIKELLVTIRVTLNTQLQDIAKQSVYKETAKETPVVRISEYNRENGITFYLVYDDNRCSAFVKDVDGNLRKTMLVPQD